MRLVMTLLVRDEEDIVCENVLYHLHMGVDFVVATDNRSADRTVDILRRFEDQGLLHLIREEEDNYAQSIWVSRMANMAKAQFGADWVINSDADEFWWPASGDLPEALGRIPSGYDVVSAPRRDFVPRPPEGAMPWHERMVFRETSSTNSRGRPLKPKVCHRGIEGVRVTQGNHAVSWPDGLAASPQTPIEILHFPLRSYLQFENKIAKGGAAYERNTELPRRCGADWRRLHRQWKRGGLPRYYQEQVRSDAEIEEAVDRGLLVRDTRLRDLLRDVAGGAAV